MIMSIETLLIWSFLTLFLAKPDFLNLRLLHFLPKTPPIVPIIETVLSNRTSCNLYVGTYLMVCYITTFSCSPSLSFRSSSLGYVLLMAFSPSASLTLSPSKPHILDPLQPKECSSSLHRKHSATPSKSYEELSLYFFVKVFKVGRSFFIGAKIKLIHALYTLCQDNYKKLFWCG